MHSSAAPVCGSRCYYCRVQEAVECLPVPGCHGTLCSATDHEVRCHIGCDLAVKLADGYRHRLDRIDPSTDDMLHRHDDSTHGYNHIICPMRVCRMATRSLDCESEFIGGSIDALVDS